MPTFHWMSTRHEESRPFFSFPSLTGAYVSRFRDFVAVISIHSGLPKSCKSARIIIVVFFLRKELLLAFTIHCSVWAELNT